MQIQYIECMEYRIQRKAVLYLIKFTHNSIDMSQFKFCS